jgi:predicted dehydrogenase
MNNFNRRAFLKQLTVASLSAPFITRDLLAASPGNILRHASFGTDGMAGSDISALTANHFVKLVAVADVDSDRAAKLKKKFPEVKVYVDWRELLDKEEKNIDSVNVSTPDHMHAPIGMSAMQLGKHVYGQKPLAHEIFEVRQMAVRAREKNLVTQMGIQIHSNIEYRMAVQLVQEGVIGKIKEVHAWSGKKWGDPNPRPAWSDPAPKALHWDLWLGVVSERPFIGEGYYHPANWRKRLDFGTGTFGDMGCHIYDPVFKALELTAPISLRSEGPTPNAYNWANNAIIHYVFPGNKLTEGETVKVTWYDGDRRPAAEIQSLLEGDKLPDQGSIFVGTKGALLLPHVARPQLYPDSQFKSFTFPKLAHQDHWTQFAEACRGNGKTSAGFDYAGPLTETVLLGGVATRFPHTTLEWNTAELKFNLADANALLRRKYRKGWEVAGL